MKKSPDSVEFRAACTVLPDDTVKPKPLYEHQIEALRCLDKINKESSYSTLVVLPTGGGKTYTASRWLLNNAINKGKKILWIAHRQMLLEQAAESFKRLSPSRSFHIRIVSGTGDRSCNIDPKDDLLIVSKDSLSRKDNLPRLDKWLKGEKELYLIVDEAHHSTAKTYRRIIDHVKSKVPNLKLIGLTATPFRTAESEQGLLAKIYSDGIKNGRAVHNDIGIAYKIGLKDLIGKGILAKPILTNCQTDEQYGKSLGAKALKDIQHLDILPEDIATEIAESTARNKLIVDTYKANKSKYGQTIVFAVNVDHAIALTQSFKKAGVTAGYVVSLQNASGTSGSSNQKENARKIKDFRDGKLQVLINVNILTEGIDLPQTKTVFLARPTVSSILMTQMVGRALRGTKAGGTKFAYIVSFVDKWDKKIAWVNPDSLFGGNNDFSENKSERTQHYLRLIAVAKIEEFASLMDDAVDTSALEKVPFLERFPIGMYAFSYLGKNGMDHTYEVMVYNSSKDSYDQLMKSLPALFKRFGVTEEEYPSEDKLKKMERHCKDKFFDDDLVPAYDANDVINILRYYAQQTAAPQLYTFDEIDRSQLDMTALAKRAIDERMDPISQGKYIDDLWGKGNVNLLRLTFGKKDYFLKQFFLELMNLMYRSDAPVEKKSNVKYDRRKPEDMSLPELRERFPKLERQLRKEAFEKAKNERGFYQCAICKTEGRTTDGFEVDHKVAMNNGGKSVPDNLQILCRKCNRKKGTRS